MPDLREPPFSMHLVTAGILIGGYVNYRAAEGSPQLEELIHSAFLGMLVGASLFGAIQIAMHLRRRRRFAGLQQEMTPQQFIDSAQQRIDEAPGAQRIAPDQLDAALVAMERSLRDDPDVREG